MSSRLSGKLPVLALLAATVTPLVSAQTPGSGTGKASMMTKTARGTFEVKLAALPIEVGPTVGRRSIGKTFAGDLTGTSVGQMISALGGVEGSAGYVAMELVTGTLQGRRGSFVLQHSSTMTRGQPSQSIVVVPDSGTEELTGLSGSMQIAIEGGKHSYVFEYSLPD